MRASTLQAQQRHAEKDAKDKASEKKRSFSFGRRPPWGHRERARVPTAPPPSVASVGTLPDSPPAHGAQEELSELSLARLAASAADV